MTLALSTGKQNTHIKYQRFFLGNLPSKFKPRLEGIHLVLLSPANFISKYGYNSILSPLPEDLKKFENQATSMDFQGVLHRFKGTVTMVIADNLAAHALGGFFSNFSTIQRFCTFCNCRKSQLQPWTKLLKQNRKSIF